MNIKQQIKEIENIINKTVMMDIIKHEVSKIGKTIITSGDMIDEPEYDIVIKHKLGLTENDEVKRRIKSKFAKINVDNIVSNIIGIKI